MPAKERRPRRFQRHHRLHYLAMPGIRVWSLPASPSGGLRAAGSKLQGPAKPDSRLACGAGFSGGRGLGALEREGRGFARLAYGAGPPEAGGRGLGPGRGRGGGGSGCGEKGGVGRGGGGRPLGGSESPDRCPRGRSGLLAAVSRAAPRLGCGEWLARPERPSPGEFGAAVARGRGRRPVRGDLRAGPEEAAEGRTRGGGSLGLGGGRGGPLSGARAGQLGLGFLEGAASAGRGERPGAPPPAPLFTGRLCTLPGAAGLGGALRRFPGAPHPRPVAARGAPGCDTSAAPAPAPYCSPPTLGGRGPRAVGLPSSQPGRG